VRQTSWTSRGCSWRKDCEADELSFFCLGEEEEGEEEAGFDYGLWD
jgi:hypothetical protein